MASARRTSAAQLAENGMLGFEIIHRFDVNGQRRDRGALQKNLHLTSGALCHDRLVIDHLHDETPHDRGDAFTSKDNVLRPSLTVS
jgi:hypothetical protein